MASGLVVKKTPDGSGAWARHWPRVRPTMRPSAERGNRRLLCTATKKGQVAKGPSLDKAKSGSRHRGGSDRLAAIHDQVLRQRDGTQAGRCAHQSRHPVVLDQALGVSGDDAAAHQSRQPHGT
jgi:hypothetical protein